MQRISKTRALLAIALAAIGANVSAQEPSMLRAVTVARPSPYFMRALIKCTPPTSEPVCERFHWLLRANFSKRELGMLFGPSTAYLEYRASYDRVKARYAALLRNVAENGLPPMRVEQRIEHPSPLHEKPPAAKRGHPTKRRAPLTAPVSAAPNPGNTALSHL